MSCCICNYECGANLTVERQAAAASKSKCGYDELGTPSSPPKVYRRVDYTQDVSDTGPICECPPEDPPEDFVPGTFVLSTSYSVTASKEVDLETCEETSDSPVSTQTYEGCNDADGFDVPVSATVPYPPLIGDWDIDSPTSASRSETVANGDAIPDACPPGPQMVTTANTLTLSSEFTTGQLIAQAAAALSAASLSAWSAGFPTATRNLATNERSISLSKAKYRIRIQPLSPTCKLTVTWQEIFTPEGGGDPTITDREYNWSGSGTPCTSGIDPLDPETWPLTPEYTMDAPSTDGVLTLGEITVTCPP